MKGNINRISTNIFRMLMTGLFLVSLNHIAFCQSISVKSTAMSPSGAKLNNYTGELELSFVKDSLTGSVVYSEKHNVTTGGNGAYSVIAGLGTNSTGTFPSQTDLQNNIYYIRTTYGGLISVQRYYYTDN